MYIVTTPVINVAPIDTVILNQYEQALLIQMIGSDSLTLLYRGSRDGFKSSNFHANVDNIPNTIVIIKQKNKDSVFGGVTSVAWDSSSGYKSDTNAYLFSIRRVGSNTNGINQIMVKDSSKALYCNRNFGPYFGTGDLKIVNNPQGLFAMNQMTACMSYYCPDGFDQASSAVYYFTGQSDWFGFKAQDIEVFQYAYSYDY